MAYSWSIETGGHALQSIELVADPAVVFNRRLLRSSLVSSANDFAIRSVYSDVRFDDATATFKVIYNFHEYMADPFCRSILLPETQGHYVVAPGVRSRRLTIMLEKHFWTLILYLARTTGDGLVKRQNLPAFQHLSILLLRLQGQYHRLNLPQLPRCQNFSWALSMTMRSI